MYRQLTTLTATILATALLAPATADARQRTPNEVQVERILDALNVRWGTLVNEPDLDAGARRLKVALDAPETSPASSKEQQRHDHIDHAYPQLIAAMRDRIAAQLDEIGFGYGKGLDDSDLQHLAERHGVSIGQQVDPGDLQLLFERTQVWVEAHRAHQRRMSSYRASIGKVIKQMGRSYGNAVDDSDVRALAKDLGVNVGTTIQLHDLARVLDHGHRHTGMSTELMATSHGVEINLPAHRVVGAGYHQAPRSGAARLPLQKNIGFTMYSRGRGTHRRSAVDVAMRRGEDVLAPVTGVVEQVVHYRLYNRYNDSYVVIRPDAQPDKVVYVLHLKGVTVTRGTQVHAGRTVIADTARTFPFQSQIEKYVGRHPHIDITVRNG